MGKLSQSIVRTILLVILLLGFVTFVSIQHSFAVESGLLDSEILGASALGGDIQSVSSKLEGKSAREGANIKAAEIARQGITGSFTSGDVRMDIESVEKIEGGVQVFARAWRNGEPIGFGADGTVEVERFLIYNPPILVPDESGPIVRSYKDENGETKEVKYREDIRAALIETLAHTMKVAGQDGSRIIKGKRGNTTSTFYSSTSDATIAVDGTGSWSAARDATSGTVYSSDTSNNVVHASQGGSSEFYVRRFVVFFDTSPIGTDSISAATYSLFTSDTHESADSDTIHVVNASALSDPPVSADFNDFGATSGGSKTIATFSNTVGVENDITLNATGIGFINKTGTTTIGLRSQRDMDNASPTGWNRVKLYMADQTGTTNDPKLVVVHSMAGTAPTSLLTNGQTNPSDLSGTTPEFSAVYNDPDSSDVAMSYRIQVATSSAFTSAYWDSGKVTLASSTPQGTRIADVTYGGTALASSTTYYWRIKFWDSADVEGAWSTETATFSLAAAAPTKVRKSVNESLANSTLLQSDDQLRIALTANTTYIVDGIVFASSTSGTPDLTIGFSSPSGATLTIGYTNAADQEVLTANATSSRIALTANTPRSVHFKGTIKTSGSSGGDLILQWAQATANAAATTVMQGSYIRVDAI
ncbi:hypothetical protein C4556_01950 [Candidatus Parcubacteria bacterium]|nr:MAG: hypothetical protein C4556_01950 [Candidatus Parcubacteria bacterium]